MADDLPLVQLTLPVGQANGNPVNGQSFSGDMHLVRPGTSIDSGFDYTIPDLAARPRGALYIQRIFLPITIAFGAPNPPSQCQYALFLNVAGEIRWTHSGLINFPVNSGSGFDVINDDLINPIKLASEEVGKLSYSISFINQPVTSWSIYIPSGGTGTQYAPGAIYAGFEPD